MSFLTASDTAYITGIFHSGHWETFSHQNLVVHRKPKEVISNVSGSYYYGYSRDHSNKSNITYIPQSSIFPCILRHKTDKQEDKFMPESMARIIDGDARIKILQDAKNYIEAEEVQGLQIDDQYFDLNSEPFMQNFLGLKYYYYDINKKK